MSLPIQSILNFKDRCVIVTGSSGSIGRHIALRFAEAGANVIVHYHSNQREAESCVKSIRQLGRDTIAIKADLGLHTDVERLFRLINDKFGQIDVLINNAGLYPVTPLIEMTVEQWEQVLNSNLRSVFLCTQAVARIMINSGTHGSIINIASIEAMNPAKGHSHYNAAKAGVLMYTRSSARELGPEGIRVNAISPGLIWREGLDEAWPDGVRRYREAVPLGRLGRPEDIADACLFLASPAARWITGANLVVDGGVLTSTVY